MKKKDQLIAAKQEVETFCLDTGWYDFWHIHLDWWGQGDKSIEEHRKFIILYLDLLDRITEQAQAFDIPWQAFLIIVPEDSSGDGAYFHTPNPNQDNFPLDYSIINWEIECPALLDGLLEYGRHLVGEYYYEGLHEYFIKLR